MPDGLLITVRFPRRAYSGGDYGTPEDVPSPARLHAAFVAAAGGGPSAEVDGRVLVATDAHAEAVRFLELHEPLAISVPDTVVNQYEPTRFRLRAAVDHNDDTPFEPFAALGGPIVYVWPPAPTDVVAALSELAAEITHVGRADSIALVDVRIDMYDEHAADVLTRQHGRGRGRAVRIATAGRFDALVGEHRALTRPGGHTAGSSGKQAKDVIPTGIGDRLTELRRFAAPAARRWVYDEAWCVELPDRFDWCLAPGRRVLAATRIHRALVAAIGDDVPSFVTGRDGDGPLRGAGHLAIQLTRLHDGAAPTLVLGLPTGVSESDRARLLTVLAARVPVRMGGETLWIGAPTIRSAERFWGVVGRWMLAETPVVLDAPGTPRNAPWTLDDAVICSVGYALRGPLEDAGLLTWGRGWSFRRDLVRHLRSRGVDARARRVTRDVSRYAHRGREGDLIVAVDADVSLGEMANGGELLAIGRARHLGGGLLRPGADR